MFASPVRFPNSNGAVVSTGGDLSRGESLQGEDESEVASESLDQIAVDGPQLHSLVVGAGGEPNSRDFNDLADDVIMSVRDLLLQIQLEPEAKRLVLRTSDDDPVWKRQYSDSMRVAVEDLLALPGGDIPNASCAVP